LSCCNAAAGYSVAVWAPASCSRLFGRRLGSCNAAAGYSVAVWAAASCGKLFFRILGSCKLRQAILSHFGFLQCCGKLFFHILSSCNAISLTHPAQEKNNLTTDKNDGHRYENPCLSVYICG